MQEPWQRNRPAPESTIDQRTGLAGGNGGRLTQLRLPRAAPPGHRQRTERDRRDRRDRPFRPALLHAISSRMERLERIDLCGAESRDHSQEGVARNHRQRRGNRERARPRSARRLAAGGPRRASPADRAKGGGWLGSAGCWSRWQSRCSGLDGATLIRSRGVAVPARS